MEKKITFLHKAIIYAGSLIFSLLSAMIMKYQQTGNAFVPETWLAASTIFVIIISVYSLIGFFKKRMVNITHSEFNQKVVPYFLFFLITVVLVSNIAVSLGVFAWYIIKGFDLAEFLPNLFRYELSYANKSLIFWLVFISLTFFYTLWKKTAQKEQALREQNLKYRYQALKSQVNPHFLFNSLNTLSELIHTDVNIADSFIQNLSSIYRYILSNEESDLVGLETEVNFVRQYFNLQKERDNDKIFLEMELKAAQDYQVVPLSMQMLVENAIKHNSISHDRPLRIRIMIQGEYLIVSNNIQRKNIIENSTQKGLQNLSERVRLILGKELILEEDKNEFVVKLPLKSTKA